MRFAPPTIASLVLIELGEGGQTSAKLFGIVHAYLRSITLIIRLSVMRSLHGRPMARGVLLLLVIVTVNGFSGPSRSSGKDSKGKRFDL